MAKTILSPFLGSISKAIIVVSVLYAFAWIFAFESGEGDISELSMFNLADDSGDTSPVITDSTTDTQSSGWYGIDIGKALWGLAMNFLKFLIGFVFDLISWLTPFSLIRGFIKMLLEPMDSMLYQVFNLFILRPIGLITFTYQINYLLAYFKIGSE